MCSATFDLIHRNCPLCAHDNRTTPASAYGEDRWPLKACVRCGFVYLETSPDYAALSGEFAWDNTFHSWHAERSRSPQQAMLSQMGRGVRRGARIFFKRRRMDELMVQYAAPGNILDVGCGKGSQLRRLPEAYVPFGIEISPGQAACARELLQARGGDVIVGPGAEALMQLPERFFSGVMMRSYLEHEAEPRRALQGAARVLAPRGIVIIKVPNYGCLNRWIFGRRWCGFRFPDHVNYFTPQTLRRLCEEVGLVVSQFGIRDRLPTGDNMWLVATKP